MNSLTHLNLHDWLYDHRFTLLECRHGAIEGRARDVRHGHILANFKHLQLGIDIHERIAQKNTFLS